MKLEQPIHWITRDQSLGCGVDPNTADNFGPIEQADCPACIEAFTQNDFPSTPALAPSHPSYVAPVRDIREAMHPADSLTPEDAAAFTRQQERLDAFGRGEPDPHPPFAKWLDPETAAAAERAAHPLQTLLGGPHVATLPDGSRVNLPAGTVLREGEGPPSTIEQARDLLRRAQAWIAPGVPDIARPGTEAQPAAAIGQLRAEIVAFLAGAAPPEHPVIALVRSFVGKPGDRGPVWGALMRLRERLDETGDLASVDLGDELVAALNERLGQMHDALGRDTTEERTL